MSESPKSVPGSATSGSDAPLRAGLRYGLLGLGVLVVLAVVLGLIFAGMPGLWGALLGAAIGGGFILTTVLVTLVGAKLPPSTAGLVMLASWVGKVLVVLIVVGVLNQFDFYSRPTLFLTVVGALLIVLGAETFGVLRQKVPYVETTAGDSDPTPDSDLGPGSGN